MTDAAPANATALYDLDFFLWTQEQAALLEAGDVGRLDIDNLVEEIRSMGNRDKNAVFSNMRIVLLHLLKVEFQPNKQTRSWLGSIVEHRQRLADDFRSSPSLKRHARLELDSCYSSALLRATIETELPLDSFPKSCPYTFQQALDSAFFPSSQNTTEAEE